MATFEKRGSATRAQVRKGGQNVTGTFDTRAAAEKWAAGIEARIDAGETIRKFDDSGDPYIAAVFDQYARKVSAQRGHRCRWEQNRLKALGGFAVFAETRVSEFVPKMLGDWRDERVKTCKGSTVNRDMNLISAVFTRAINEWGMPFAKGINPVSLVARPASPAHRTRRVSDHDIFELCNALGYAQGTAPETNGQKAAWAFLFALSTAMRRGEILGIHWRDVHPRYVHLPMTKNGESRNVPLSKRSLELLSWLPKGEPDDAILPINYSTLGWQIRDACDRRGLKNLRFHDTRHEATTQIATKVHNVLELGAITGHKDLKMLKTYFNPTPDELADLLD